MSDNRILLVDDEEMILELFQPILQERGYHCDTAPAGPPALKLLDAHTYSVMITDLRMADMNGLELTRQAKKMQPDLVVILLTGAGTRSDSIAAIKEGVFDFLEKPVEDLHAFFYAVDRAVGQYNLVTERKLLTQRLTEQKDRLEVNLRKLNEAYDKLIRQEQALEKDLRQAQMLQQSLLPASMPAIDGIQCCGLYQACQRLGGDFFDVIKLRNGKVAIYLTDVVGHGVRAAMITVIVRELIRGHILLNPDTPIFEDPAQALHFLNKCIIEEQSKIPTHVTMGYAVVDPEKGRVLYAGAGQPAPLLLRKSGEVRFVKTEAPALGIEATPLFENVTLNLRMHDALLLYSDGITEARNMEGKELGIDPLCECLKQCAGESAQRIAECIEDLIERHADLALPSDDISMVLIQRAKASDAPQESAVKIIESGASEKIEPNIPAQLACGWDSNHLVLRFTGNATWQQADLVCRLIDEALDREAGGVYLELSQCKSMDSTMLGSLYRYSNDITLCRPTAKLIEQFRELGILGFLSITEEPPPETDMTVIADSLDDLSRKQSVILSAHEALLEVSKPNRLRFQSVVDFMKEEQANRSKTG